MRPTWPPRRCRCTASRISQPDACPSCPCHTAPPVAHRWDQPASARGLHPRKPRPQGTPVARRAGARSARPSSPVTPLPAAASELHTRHSPAPCTRFLPWTCRPGASRPAQGAAESTITHRRGTHEPTPPPPNSSTAAPDSPRGPPRVLSRPRPTSSRRCSMPNTAGWTSPRSTTCATASAPSTAPCATPNSAACACCARPIACSARPPMTRCQGARMPHVEGTTTNFENEYERENLQRMRHPRMH